MRPDRERPCVIFDSHHPKHYLTVRRLGARCREHGIRVIWTARDKDVLLDLMRADGNEPHCLTRPRGGLAGKLGELAVYDWRLARLAVRDRPFALMGKAVSLAHVGRVLGIPSILINDDSAAANPQYRWLGYPFAHRILTAECLGERYGARQRTYSGLMELAYLHPNAFSPDPGIRAELGVGADERLFLIRLVAFEAYHDVGEIGISRSLLDQILARLNEKGRPYIVPEGPLPNDLACYALPTPPARLRHVLAACDLVIGDGPTVPVEAALLGRPAIAFGTYMRKNAYLRALEQDFALIDVFEPGEEAAVLADVDRLTAAVGALSEWQARRTAMLREWCDPTDIYWQELAAVLERTLGRRLAVCTPIQPT